MHITTNKLGTGLATVLAFTALTAGPAFAGQHHRDGSGPTTAAQSCDLAVWYVVHNPSINKPRGHQDAPDFRTMPTGPCPT